MFFLKNLDLMGTLFIVNTGRSVEEGMRESFEDPFSRADTMLG